MRTGRTLILAACICAVTALAMPGEILAEEVGDGETTIHIRVPKAHTMDVKVGVHGALQINGARLTGSQKISIKRLTEPRFVITPDSGYEIDAIYYNGKNVTGELKDYSYTAPLLYEDDIVLRVSFKKKAGTTGGGSSVEENKPSRGGDAIDGNDPLGENASDSGASGTTSTGDHISSGESSSSTNGTSDNKNTETETKDTTDKSGIKDADKNESEEAVGKMNSTKEEGTLKKVTDKEKTEERKDEIFRELDRIDELLKDENLSEVKKQELQKKQRELLDELMNVLIKKEVSGKQEIRSTVADIDKLLMRGDLTEAQRKQLLEKKAALTEQLEGARQSSMLLYILAGVLLIFGTGYYFYRKKKAS